MDIRSLLIKGTASILDALRAINSASSQLCLVINDREELIGVVTDGDIRRALLKGHQLEDNVLEITNKDFYSHNENQNTESMKTFMRSKGIVSVPVVDNDNKPVDVIGLNDLLGRTNFVNPIVIMAGGRGERLLPMTQNIPKPMIPLSGKPLLEIILENCIDKGFRKFFFTVNYLKDQIMDYFGNGQKWEVSIEYIIETSPLGTAGSLALLPKEIKNDFIVINGDVLTHLQLPQVLDFHLKNNSVGTICVVQNQTQIPYGVVNAKDNKLISITEKPILTHLINAGIYILNPEILSLLQDGVRIDMPSLLLNANQLGMNVNVFPVHEYWIDVGLPETLKIAESDWYTL